MPPLRVCQLITELRPAGAERCVYELARRLDRGRFEVRVVALRGGAMADALRQAGVETEVLNVRGKWDAFKVFHLAGLLRRWEIDLLHTHLFHADLAGRTAAALAQVPHLVHTVHVAERRWRPWQFAWANLAGGRCDRIVAVSCDVAEHHARLSGLPIDRYEVIPNGIDVAAYARDEAARRRLREQWGVPDGCVLAAFVGRLDRQKGLDVLLYALSHVYTSNPSLRPVLRLVVAGEGPQRRQVEALLAKMRLGEQVRLLGFASDVRGILSAADLFVMPSRWEGFGLAAAEAMAAGLPVIASRVEGLRDVVAEGESGLLVAADDAEALARSVEVLVRDAAGRGAMGRAGQRRAMELFQIERNVETHERLYLRVSGRKGTDRQSSGPLDD